MQRGSWRSGSGGVVGIVKLMSPDALTRGSKAFVEERAVKLAD